MDLKPKDIDNVTLELISKTEDSLLGALFIAGASSDMSAIETVSKIVKPGDFLSPYQGDYRRRIYEAMLIAPRTDQITVANVMHVAGTLQSGDIACMSLIIAGAVTSLDCEIYARQVKQLAEERRGQRPLKFKGGV